MADSKLAEMNSHATRIGARANYRARIEALLDEANGEVLADVWQKVCPLRVDKLPQRHEVIEDLADFAKVLQPRLAGMQADELCRLIEKYAAPFRKTQTGG